MHIVWWPTWHGFDFYRFKRGMAKIYRWSLVLGFIEIRRWA
jgi:hypothetical protein